MVIVIDVCPDLLFSSFFSFSTFQRKFLRLIVTLGKRGRGGQGGYILIFVENSMQICLYLYTCISLNYTYHTYRYLKGVKHTS